MSLEVNPCLIVSFTPASWLKVAVLRCGPLFVPLPEIVARGGWSPGNGDILVKLMAAAEDGAQ